MDNIAILGGTFDPIHNGHLRIAHDVIWQLKMDMVYFIPASKSNLKEPGPVATPEQRYKMVELAIQGESKIDVLDWEILKPDISYTLDTARLLKKHWPKKRFFWIIGSDLVSSLDKWKGINELVNLLEFIVIERPGYHYAKPNISNLKLYSIQTVQSTISSTEIRDRLHEGIPVEDTIPETVLNYIIVNKIYNGRKS